jgi:hypothetical protein
MKKERILIFTDSHKQADFENLIEATQSESNRLIELYHSFQPWNKIKTIQEFEALCSDPLGEYDRTLQNNFGVDLKSTGGLKPAPAMVAKLLDLDRENWINVIKGLKVSEGCKSCNKTPKIIKQGQGVISFQTYKKYQDYLTFENGRFSINENAVSEKKDSFQVYAETPAQIECWNFWHNVCDVLNSLQEKNYCTDIHAFQTLLKNRVMFSYANNKLNIDETALIQEINSLKN